MLELKKPIVFFDIESTGLSIVHDRIVDLTLLKVLPTQEEEGKNYLLNPEKPISAEATAIHGITNEQVANQPTFADVAQEMFEFIGDSDLAGFNALKFDIPMLMEEFLRCAIEFDISNKECLDVQVIFHKKEPRTLAAAYKFYCNKNLDEAHTAQADTRATLEVFRSQMQKYDDLPANLQDLNKYIGLSKRLDLEGRIVLDKNEDAVFNFGKHRGKKVVNVFERDPGYYDWMMSKDFSLYTKQIISTIKKNMLKAKFAG